jgi:hypothetical protein
MLRFFMKLIKISEIQQKKENIQVTVITDTYKCKKEEVEKFCKMVVRYIVNEWVDEGELVYNNDESYCNIVIHPFNPDGKPIKIIV